MRAMTGKYTGKSPYKAHKNMWKDIDRESALLVEYDPNNKNDVMQRSTFRDCFREEDRVYCIMSYFGAKVNVEYGIGMYEALRNLLCSISPDDIPSLLLTNWYPSDDTPKDLCSLSTFSRDTAALWFNARSPICKCTYIRNVGIEISTKTVDVEIYNTHEVGEEYNYFATINGLCNMSMTTFGRMQSILTGAVEYRGDWICSLVCTQIKGNIYRKVGMCCLNMENCKEYVSDKVLILA
jgi:hypothetical protein